MDVYIYYVDTDKELGTNIDKELDSIHAELMNLAQKERDLLLKQRKLRCIKNQSCSMVDLITAVQIG